MTWVREGMMGHPGKPLAVYAFVSIDMNREMIGITHVWPELEVADATGDVLIVRVIKMTVKDLLGKRKWPL